MRIFYFLEFFFSLQEKKNKSDYISKTKIRTKNIIYAKNERQVNSNLFCKFCY